MTPIVSICSVLFDLDGHADIYPSQDTDLGDITRRVNKQKTLDGGVVILDGGSTQSDRDMSIAWKTQDREYEDRISAIVSLHSLVYIFCRDGVFLAVPEKYTSSRGTSSLRLLIKEKANA